jgi:iduronate 2-sulfatase
MKTNLRLCLLSLGAPLLVCLLLSHLATVRAAAAKSGKTSDRQPNVLLLMADDLNTALSGFGHPQCQTPRLDRLAREGVRFENMHCQYPVCGASRASLMTGLYPYTNGMLGNGGDLRKNLPNVVTMSQLFRQNGYRVGRVSKIYHMGIPPEIIAGTADHDDPQSWDEVVNIKAPEQNAPGVKTQWSPKDKSSQTFLGVEAEGGDLAHADGMAAEAAIAFLKRNRDGPFFLACGFVRPHVPLVAPTKYFDRYDRESMVAPIVPKDDLDDVPGIIRDYKSNSRYGVTPELHKGLLEAYYASISYMDAQVGKVLDALDELGLKENTIVVFSSDHGYLLGHHHKFQKQHLFEEATRVPFILRTPWIKKPHGRATKHITELIDLYPTLAELAGLTPPGDLQGNSLVPLLNDPVSTDWTKESAFTISRSGGESIRTHEWRYTQWGFGAKGQELFDLKNDPGEFTNRAGDPDFAGQRNRLRRLLETKRRAAGYDPQRYRIKNDDRLWPLIRNELPPNGYSPSSNPMRFNTIFPAPFRQLWTGATLLALASFTQAQSQSEKIMLWPSGAPIGDGTKETVKVPITVHRPSPGKANGTALIICPGGGYGGLVTGAEGHGIAKWLGQHGITGVVLEYRLPRGRSFVPLMDAQRAIRIVRTNAKKWEINPDRVGIIGFSAGGHLAATAVTHFDSGDAQAKDPIKRQSSRPDFGILVYPVIGMGKIGHAGSRKNLLGPTPRPELIKLFSNEKQVTPKTPPVYLAHAVDDKPVPIANSRQMHQALKAKNIPTEYLELPSGGHGLNGYKGPMWNAWQTGSLKWLKKLRLLN